jgi:hypothetical protein
METVIVEELINSLNSIVLEEKKNVNKGTGAGGAKTNENGKNFEELTNNETRLISQDFKKTIIEKKKKFGYFLYKNVDEFEIIFMLQSGFKTYFKDIYNINFFRNPDEAYVIKSKNGITIKILEKKNQNVDGSVDTKLLAGPSFKDEYELVANDNDSKIIFKVEYAFCLSNWFKEQKKKELYKYKILEIILNKSNIKIFYGEDEDYYEKLDSWINDF